MLRLKHALCAMLVALACVGLAADQQQRHRIRKKALSGDTLATETVTQAGWATFGIALKQGDATSNSLKVGSLSTQVDVKRTWGDGSIKHAIVTVNYPSTGSYAITSAAAASGTFTPTWPTLTVTVTQTNSPGGSSSAAGTYTATLGSYSGTDAWLSGPNANEARVEKDFLNGATPHTNLKAVFDVRAFSDGDAVIDIIIENCLDNSTNEEYIYGISINEGGGAAEYTESGLHHLPFQRKVKRLEVGSPALAEVSRDMTPFYTSAAFPRYLSDTLDMTIADGDINDPETTHGYTSMDGLGPFLLPMEAHGGRPELGLLSGWVTSWIVHQRQEQWEFISKLTEYAGNYAIHVRRSDNTDIKRTADSDMFWLHRGATGAYLPATGAAVFTPTAASVTLTSNGTTATATFPAGVPGYISPSTTIILSGASVSAWNNIDITVQTIPTSTTLTFAAPTGATTITGTITARIHAAEGEINHLPNMAYAQYLASGRRFAMDEMIYYANFCVLNTSPEQRGFGYGYLAGASNTGSKASRGLVNSQGTQNYPELRGSAWGLRDLAWTAGWLPDSHSLKSYFTTIAQNNLNDIDGFTTAKSTAPSGDPYGIYLNANTALDAPFPMKRPEDDFVTTGYPNKAWLSGFEQPYMAVVLHYAIRNQGWSGGGAALAMLGQFWSRLHDTAQIPAGFDISCGTPYVVAAGVRGYAPSRTTFYTTMQEVYDHTFTVGAGGVDGVTTCGGQQNAVFIRALLKIAAYDGFAGASAGVTYLDRLGGQWNNTYRTSAEYAAWAFDSVTPN